MDTEKRFIFFTRMDTLLSMAICGDMPAKLKNMLKKLNTKKKLLKLNFSQIKTLIPLKKGDMVAYSGNTGGSGGPHLHFEIRDASQRPMNPSSSE